MGLPLIRFACHSYRMKNFWRTLKERPGCSLKSSVFFFEPVGPMERWKVVFCFSKKDSVKMEDGEAWQHDVQKVCCYAPIATSMGFVGIAICDVFSWWYIYLYIHIFHHIIHIPFGMFVGIPVPRFLDFRVFQMVPKGFHGLAEMPSSHWNM